MYYIVVSWVAMRKTLYDIDILIQYFYNLKFLWGAHAFIIFFSYVQNKFYLIIFIFLGKGGVHIIF